MQKNVEKGKLIGSTKKNNGRILNFNNDNSSKVNNPWKFQFIVMCNDYFTLIAQNGSKYLITTQIEIKT